MPEEGAGCFGEVEAGVLEAHAALVVYEPEGGHGVDAQGAEGGVFPALAGEKDGLGEAEVLGGLSDGCGIGVHADEDELGTMGEEF